MKRRAGNFLFLAACAALIAACACVVIFQDQLHLFLLNAEAGCWPWSPTDALYRDGMTICPGQSVHVKIIIQMRQADDGSI